MIELDIDSPRTIAPAIQEDEPYESGADVESSDADPQSERLSLPVVLLLGREALPYAPWIHAWSARGGGVFSVRTEETFELFARPDFTAVPPRPCTLAVGSVSSLGSLMRSEVQSLRPRHLLAIADSSELAARALRFGVDDVIRSPFTQLELWLRMSRLVTDPIGKRGCGPLRIDGDGRARVGERVLSLRRAEAALLSYLVQEQPRIVSKEELLRVALRTAGDGSAIRFHVCELRKKLRGYGADVIRTQRGAGYWVQDDEDVKVS